MIDVAAVAARTGWRVHHLARTPSTMDEAARLRAGGAGARTVVVADRQDAGRGRDGRSFASPPGGLYASLLVGPRGEDLPGPLVAASALATAEAIEAVAAVRVALKWPNDVWIGRRKLGGILLESVGGPRPVVAVGIGINVAAVPSGLPEDVRKGLTALAVEAGRPVTLDDLLAALLLAVDRRMADLAGAGSGATPLAAGGESSRAAVAEAWSARLALRGERVTWSEGGTRHRGVLVDAHLEEGLHLLEDGLGPRRVRGEHVHDLRPEGA